MHERNLNSPILPGILFLAVVVLFTAHAPASISVSQWGLEVLVDGGPGGGAASRGFSTVLNPFVNQHSAALANGLTTAAAQYNISWLLDYGSFNISAHLAAQDGRSVKSQASGTVYLQTDAAMTLSLDAALHYNLPTYGLGADLSFEVRDVTANQSLFGRGVWYDTFSGPPASGGLSIASEILLPANHQCRLQYQMGLDTYGFSSGLATAPDAHVNFTLSPEPASLVLLAALLLVLPRHRPRRTRAISP